MIYDTVNLYLKGVKPHQILLLAIPTELNEKVIIVKGLMVQRCMEKLFIKEVIKKSFQLQMRIYKMLFKDCIKRLFSHQLERKKFV